MVNQNPFIGQMDRKIKIAAKVTEQSESGAEIITEQIICEPYAYMKDSSGNEQIDGKILMNISRIYIVRYRKEIMEQAGNLILSDSSQNFEVYEVSEIGRKRHILLRVRAYE